MTVDTVELVPVQIPRPTNEELVRQATTGRHKVCPKCGHAPLVHEIASGSTPGSYEAGCVCQQCSWGSALYTVGPITLKKLRADFPPRWVREHFVSTIRRAQDPWRVAAAYVGATLGELTMSHALARALEDGAIVKKNGGILE
jgi:hypothetical protein